MSHIDIEATSQIDNRKTTGTIYWNRSESYRSTIVTTCILPLPIHFCLSFTTNLITYFGYPFHDRFSADNQRIPSIITKTEYIIPHTEKGTPTEHHLKRCFGRISRLNRPQDSRCWITECSSLLFYKLSTFTFNCYKPSLIYN